MGTHRRLVAILAADIANYSVLMGADDEATVRDLKGHQLVVMPMIERHAGRVIDTAGDGVLAEFGSVVDAVNCAIAIQQVMLQRNAEAPASRSMRFRMAVNLGDVVTDEARLYGDGVNVAARLQALAEPGGFCISAKVYEEVQDKIDAAFEFVGERALKNIARPVKVWRWIAHASIVRRAAATNTLATHPLPEKPAIAVLPFDNLSVDPDQEYFADGICEDLITALSSMRWFFVIARNTTFTYKDKAVDAKRVAAELGVHYVVEGSVRKAADRVRITVQLIDGRTGTHVWAERFDGDLSDIFELQDRIVASVGSRIEPRLLESEARRTADRSASDLSAWDLVMRARSHYWRMTPSESGIAVDLLRDAVARYPTYAPAHSLLSFALLFNRSMGWIPVLGVLDEARGCAHRAADIDDLDPWVHVSLGYLAVVDRDTDQALGHFDRAIALNPNFAAAMGWKGVAAAYGGRSEEAVSNIESSIRLSPHDPQNPIFIAAKGMAYYLAGRYDMALSCTRQAIPMRPNFVAGLRIYCAALAKANDIAQANEVLARIRLLQPGLSCSTLRLTVPYARPQDMEHFLDGLRAAGLQET